MFRRYAEAERQYWLQVKPGGRSRFILRKLLWSLPVWLTWTPLMALIGFKSQPFSVGKIISIGLVGLPLWLLGGYLNGMWRWKELDKRFPE
jgi:hypothetical protein